MPFCVGKSNILNKECPSCIEELVEFVEYVRELSDEIHVQLSGYRPEVVRAISERYGCNYIDGHQSSGINPFTLIYITHDGKVRAYSQSYKSIITIYAK